MTHFVRQVWRLKKGSGLLFTALYLKQCGVALQRFYAGSPIQKEPLSTAVSLTRSGIPRIIPKYHRMIIRRRDSRSDRLVKLYLSWFGLSRIVELAKPIGKATFKSIITPTEDIDRLKGVLMLIKEYFPRLQRKYMPWISTIPLEKGMKWVPTWKSTPMTGRQFKKGWSKSARTKLDMEMPGADAPPNIFSDFKHELAAFAWNVNKVHSIQDGVFSPGILFKHCILYALDKNNIMFANCDLDYYERNVGPLFSSLLKAWDHRELRGGRLCQTLSGNGKRRLFVIGNYVKQRLLRPVHDWAMAVLRRLPCDGTYDQTAPLYKLRLSSPRDLFSYDLKSATDRWPLSVIHDYMSCLFGSTLASSIVNGTLGLNTLFVSPPMVAREREIAFLAGQGLGYYGSWALFALSHHFILWLAAEMVRPSETGLFKDYAILGDDIVIADEQIALKYRELLDDMGVTISDAKSLVSHNGTLEFAKQYWTKLAQVDLSPISLQALNVHRTTLGLCQIQHKYKIKDLKIMLRLGGAGFRTLAKMSRNQSNRWKRIIIAVSKPYGSESLPLEFWFGRGLPLDPYLKGIMVAYLLDTFRVKEIKMIPKHFVFDGEVEILERTVLRNWMEMWLHWLKWYHTMLMSNPTLSELLDAPVVPISYRRTEFKPLWFRFGVVWKLYDMAAQTGPRFILDQSKEPVFTWCLTGGKIGSQFITGPISLPPIGYKVKSKKKIMNPLQDIKE